MPVQRRNVHSVAKSGSTPLNGDVTLTGGTNVTLTQSGNDISIAATGGGGTNATNLSATLSATNTIINSDTGTSATIPAVDATNAGVMTPTQKSKLDGIASGATANTGTVTSVGVSGANGIGVTGSPVTTSGTVALSLGAITPTSVAATGTVSGSNLSGNNTGDQTSVSGNAGTATKLATGRTIAITGDVTYTSPSFDGSANVTAAGTVTKINGTALSGLATGILKNTTTTGVPSIAVAADFPTLNQSTTGNAATATKLATARTINGVSFDGTANITVADSTKVPTTTTVNGHALSSNVTVTADDVLPTQTGNSGKFITTNGTTASWGSISGGGDMLAATYDPTAKAADAFSQDNMVDGTTNKNYTATEKTKLAGIASGATANTGDVVGPASSTDNAITRFDATTGKLVQDSLVTVDDTGNVSLPTGKNVYLGGSGYIYSNPTDTSLGLYGNDAGDFGSLNDFSIQSDLGDINLYSNHTINLQGTNNQVNGVPIVTTTNTQTLTNKDLTSGTNTFPTLNQNTTGTASNVTGTVAVANGGTGATTFTGILKGNGTSAVTAVTAPAGTIVGTTDAQTLTNKTINASNNTITNVASLSVSRQNDTTNNTITGARIETGWGLMAYNTASPTVSETVTFKTAFTTAPIVTITFGGDSPSGTSYGNGGNNVEGIVVAKAHTITTSSFTAQFHKASGSNFVAGNGFYQWIAIGA